jgi:hypothetical protein
LAFLWPALLPGAVVVGAGIVVLSWLMLSPDRG